MKNFIDLDAEPIPTPKEEVKAQNKLTIPSGYIKMSLSTDGRLGVPEEFHVRNFTTNELLDLSMYANNEQARSEKLIQLLDQMILEETDVQFWPEPAIIELLVKIYANFFEPVLLDINFPWNDEDIKYLKEVGREEEAEEIISGKSIPKSDLKLTDIVIKHISDSVRDFISIRKGKGTPVIAKFYSYPRYGDNAYLKKQLEKEFAEKDKAYASLRMRIDMVERYLDEGRDISVLQPVSESEREELDAYDIQKALWTARATMAMYLVEFKGQSYLNRSLNDKIKVLDDPDMTSSLLSKAFTKFKDTNFGIDPEVSLKNPITKAVSKRKFNFRVVDVLQLFQSFESDDFVVSYDD